MAVAIVPHVLRDRVERAREVVGCVEEAIREGRDIAYDFAFATSRAAMRRVFSCSASDRKRVVLRVLDLGFELGGSSDPSTSTSTSTSALALAASAPSPPSDPSLAAAAAAASSSAIGITPPVDCFVLKLRTKLDDDDDRVDDGGVQ